MKFSLLLACLLGTNAFAESQKCIYITFTEFKAGYAYFNSPDATEALALKGYIQGSKANAQYLISVDSASVGKNLVTDLYFKNLNSPTSAEAVDFKLTETQKIKSAFFPALAHLPTVIGSEFSAKGRSELSNIESRLYEEARAETVQRVIEQLDPCPTAHE